MEDEEKNVEPQTDSDCPQLEESEKEGYKPRPSFVSGGAENVYKFQKGDLLIKLEPAKSVCFAMQQNSSSLLRSFSVMNNTHLEMRGLRLMVSSTPQFFEPLYLSLDSLAAGEEHHFRNAVVTPDFDYLATVTERIRANVTVDCEIGETPVKRESEPINILAFDEWPGMGTVPELLACFSTPRDPAVNGIISEAAQLLKQENLSFDGYQSGDPNVVNKQLAAIFSVIKARNIAYSMPPASFEQSGQKIRLPKTIVDLGLGTCLDTTMLLCSCAEAVGINPVIFIFNGHAFPGFWLKETTFPEVINDDLSAVNKRMAGGLSELAALESTLLTDNKSAYVDAVKNARERLHTGKGFVCYIDVSRARKSGILPLPIRYEEDGKYFVDRKMYEALQQEVKDLRVRDGNLESTGLKDRLEKWQRDLLDITLRNPLINYRINRAGVPMLNFDVEAVEKAFAEGKSLQIAPTPKELGRQITDITNLSVENDPQLTNILKNDLASGSLRSALKEEDLVKRLTTLFRQDREAMEESGANLMYLALGFLKWREADKPNVDRFAPILLLPMEITRRSANSGYQITLREDEYQPNLSLIEMLRVNYKIDASGLKDLQKDLPESETGVDVRQAFTYIRKLIIEQKGWDVVEAASLGAFQFAKFVLWNDLKTRELRVRSHPLTGAMISAKNSPALYESAFKTDGRLYLPLDSDSSQTDASKAAAEGKTFVLHGPPGTGKSQVITNVIANALAHGQRVLFIAEKIAALDVVKRRLSRLGLFDFCLELHSNKSQKRGFYEQFDRLLELAESATDVKYDEAAEKLDAAAAELDTRSTALHKQKKIGQSVFSGINRLLETAPEGCDDFIQIRETDIEKSIYERGLDVLRPLSNIGEALGEPVNAAFYGCSVTEYSFDLRDKVIKLTQTLSDGYNPFQAAYEELVKLVQHRKKPKNLYDSESVHGLYYVLGELLHYKSKNGFLKFLLAIFSKRYRSMRKSRFYKKIKKYCKEQPDDAQLVFESIKLFIEAEAELKALLLYGDKYEKGEMWSPEIYGAAELYRRHIRDLREMCVYNTHLEQCAAFPQLAEISQRYHTGQVESKDVVPLFERSFWNAWVRREISSDPALNSFSPSEYATKRERFKALTEFTAKLTQKEVFLKLASKLPNFKYAAQATSEPGILLKAVKSRGRGITIRQIFSRVPNLLAKVKPCMLMSPLSAAQYLPEDFPEFDLVVFDEASQLLTCDAAGAISRGKCTVVVGDPKQLPPTTFFSSRSDDEDDSFELHDLESVLDDMLTLNVHEKRLLWHYRSEHESLIAFPNANYYDNRLITFPTPDDTFSRVEFRRVNGTYDRGGTRTNQKEAEAVVEELFDCLKDSEKSKLSYGIVTFNVTQQNLIQDLVDKRIAKEPMLDKFFSTGESPVFIKNIESVQGDERDVIIFSITYGMDKEGKMTVNFGPINKDGGWRRLNVAITRSCKRILVFSTITPDTIDLSRTSARGVEGLKGFMNYAINPRAFFKTAQGSASETAYIAAVAQSLREKGYRAVENMGRSLNRIDVAVQDDNGRYKLGILCDNEAMAKAANVRDREYGNENFLRHMGWNLTRAYATEWWQDPQGETKRLISIIEGKEDDYKGACAEAEIEEMEAKHQEIAFNPNIPLPVQEYVTADLPQNLPDAFYLFNHVQTVCEQVRTVIRAEGPISEQRLYKAVAAAWNIPRMSQKFNEHMAQIMRRVNPVTNLTQNTRFYWNQREDMAMSRYRAPSDRKADEIPQEEYAVAAYYIMKNAISIGHEDLVRETAKLFGFIRSPIVSMRIDMALSRLTVEGKVIKSGATYKIR
ncbi:MAG: DUF3320 domain-containing protein [Firmicutes bacterium]|nr:DUF3320 domain-containing protein [Bacillota bacterium]